MNNRGDRDEIDILHGLGQSADSWKEVQALLVDYPSESLELFPSRVLLTKKLRHVSISIYLRRKNLLS